MKYEHLQFDIQDAIAWITINRPDVHNALDLQAIRELYDIANRCGTDKSVRAVVITGAGAGAFSAGGDVADFVAHSGDVELLLKEMTGYLHLAISRLAWLQAPVIAGKLANTLELDYPPERLEVIVRRDARVRDNQNPVLHMIERQHRVEQHEARIVGAVGARAKVPQHRLEPRCRSVAEIADRAPGESRQIGHEG